MPKMTKPYRLHLYVYRLVIPVYLSQMTCMIVYLEKTNRASGKLGTVNLVVTKHKFVVLVVLVILKLLQINLLQCLRMYAVWTIL